jgi:uncharacterized membrane protein SpoIIM required for sporulation
MVLERMLNPFSLKKRPWEMFLAGFVYSLVGVGLSYIVFREVSALLMVFLIVLATLPTLYVTIKNEQELEFKYEKESRLLKEHTKVLVFLIFLFLGVTVSLTIVYVFAPDSFTDTAFGLQKDAITNVNNVVHAQITGAISKGTLLGRIFLNNTKVLFFCLVFSFIYGTGAIFILTWNASVIATAMGGLFKSEIAKTAALVGSNSVASYFGTAAFSFFKYMTHGVIEIAAYFVAGLAGGIISIALIKHRLKENKVIIDSLDLILISIGLLFAAAIVEVYVTPVLF